MASNKFPIDAHEHFQSCSEYPKESKTIMYKLYADHVPVSEQPNNFRNRLVFCTGVWNSLQEYRCQLFHESQHVLLKNDVKSNTYILQYFENSIMWKTTSVPANIVKDDIGACDYTPPPPFRERSMQLFESVNTSCHWRFGSSYHAHVESV